MRLAKTAIRGIPVGHHGHNTAWYTQFFLRAAVSTLGAHLARLELAEAVRIITPQMPNPIRTGGAPGNPLSGSPDQPLSQSNSTRNLVRLNEMADPPLVRHQP